MYPKHPLVRDNKTIAVLLDYSTERLYANHQAEQEDHPEDGAGECESADQDHEGQPGTYSRPGTRHPVLLDLENLVLTSRSQDVFVDVRIEPVDDAHGRLASS